MKRRRRVWRTAALSLLIGLAMAGNVAAQRPTVEEYRDLPDGMRLAWVAGWMSGFAIATGTDNPRSTHQCFADLAPELVTVVLDNWIVKHPESREWPARITIYRAIGDFCRASRK